MKQGIYLVLFILLTSCHGFKSNSKNVHSYVDTLNIEKRFSFITVPLIINGQIKELIFDTGSNGAILLDSIGIINTKKKVDTIMIVIDSNNKKGQANLKSITAIELSKYKISGVPIFGVDMTDEFECLSDGILGNDVIKYLNWVIKDGQLLFSKENINEYKTPYSLPMLSNSRLYTDIRLNDVIIDTCLIDSGASDEIELPLNYLDSLYKKMKVNYARNIKTSSIGINGMSSPYSTKLVNCNIDFLGISIDSVSIGFSQKNEEPRIGIGFLNRFEHVYLNYNQHKIYLGLPIKNKNAPKYLFPIQLTIQENKFIVVGLVEEMNYDIKIGDVITEINNRKADEFQNFCDLIEFYQSLYQLGYVEIVKNSKKIVIENLR